MRFVRRASVIVWCSVAAVLMLETTAQRPEADARALIPVSRNAQPARAFVQKDGIAELSQLPLPAQATISQVLGRDDRAYRAAAVDGGFSAENARHGLSAHFSPAGVAVASDDDRLTFALTAYGYGQALLPVAGAAPEAESNRVVYRRGLLTEWYVNGPLGLEQGVTLQAPPTPRLEGPLTLSFTLGGTLTPRIDASGDGLTFVSSSLRYGGLFATDADGRELPASLGLDGRTVMLRVDDVGARYPLTIDPFVQQAKLTASDGARRDDFGWAVALSGDTALVGSGFDNVGANIHQGSAYVFTRVGGVWTEQAKLIASDGTEWALFGYSVALSDDTALVGAFHGASFYRAPGSAYVFTRTDGVWTEQARLAASDAAIGSFGWSVAVEGDTALIGSLADDVGANASQGSAYVFTRVGGVWTEQARLISSDGASPDSFGVSVALSGDTALVGAMTDYIGPTIQQGSAYVFTRTGTAWTEQAKLTASDGARDDLFGYTVSLSDDTALVGSFRGDVGASHDQGSAYVFTRIGGMWTQQAKLTAADGVAEDLFGYNVALSGNTAVVGAIGDDVGANRDQGSAYVFTRAGTVWTQHVRLTSSDGAVEDTFGHVAVSGDTVLVGANFDGIGANDGQGSAYMFVVAPGQAPAALTLNPLTHTNPVNTQHCVTATVVDTAGQPVPTVSVRFAVIGAASTSGSATTNYNGQVAFCYDGPPLPGVDAIIAYADADGDNAQDENEPGGTAGNTWGCIDSDGDGICDDSASDTTPPSIEPVPDISVQATSSAGAFVNVPVPAAADIGSGVQSVSCDRTSGNFALGATLVTCTARDNANNTSSTSFTVLVGAQAGNYLVTIHTVGVGVVGVTPIGQVCALRESGLCTYQVQSGTTVVVNGNAATPNVPGIFSSGTGPASGCATSTCRFVMTGNAEITTTFDPATPVYTVLINLTGDAGGQVNTGNSMCQNYDHDPAQLLTQFSACETSYAPNSEVTLDPWPPAATRFTGFSSGTNDASVCGTGTCSFFLNGNTSVSATFSALMSIAVSPATDTISVNQSRQFTAIGTYSDLVTQYIGGGMGTWTTKASMLQSRFDFAAAAAAGRVYAFGGHDGSGPGSSFLGSVEAYDPSSNVWTAKRSMSPRAGLGAATIDGRYIYAVGGDVSGACPVATLDMYDTSNDTWTPKASMPGGPRRNLSAAVVGRTLYAIGGELNACGQSSSVPLSRVEGYNPDSDEWTALADMPTPRSVLGVGVVDGIIYAVGGGGTQGPLASVEAYNPVTNTWIAKAALPGARELHAVAVIENILYVLGGNNGGYFSSVFAYDPAFDAWSERASIPQLEAAGFAGSINGQRAELAAAALDGKVYAIGGLISSGGAPPVAIVTAFVDSLIWSSGDNSIVTIANQFQSGIAFGQATGRQGGTTGIRARAGTVACDTAPGQCATLTVSNSVSNTLPTSTIFGLPLGNPAVTINTGQNLSTTGSRNGNFHDSDQGQTWTATVNYGDGFGTQPLSLVPGNPPNGPTGTFSLNHVYGQSGGYIVTVRITDNLGGVGTATLNVIVNAAPSPIFLGLPNSVHTEVGSTQWGCGSFLDQSGSAGPWSATVNYGDGSGSQPLPLTIPAPPAGPENPCGGSGGTPPTGIFSFNHPYTSPGAFQASVTVTNTDTHASRTGGFTIDVSDGGGNNGCALVSTNLTAGTVPFSTVQMSLFDRTTGDLLFTLEVPLGMTELGEAPEGFYRVEFSVPAGYIITPAHIEFDATCGNAVVLSAHIGTVDTTAPSLTLNGANPMTVEALTSFLDPGAFAVDDVDGDLTAAIAVSGTVNQSVVGAYALTYAVSDHSGNPASATRTVNVVDTTAPMIDPHANLTAQASVASGVVVNYSAPATHDAVSGDGIAQCTPTSGSTFPVGTTMVSCTAADGAGNPASSSFDVTVTPPPVNKPPKVKVPNRVIEEATGPAGAVATFAVSANDRTDGPLPVTCSVASGTVFSLGTTTVTCSATDSSANTTEASFQVIVRDTRKPVLTVPGHIVTEATMPGGARVSYSASATDVVDASVDIVCAPDSGTVFALGTTRVDCTATDDAGNAKPGAFNVTVRDRTDPTIVSAAPSPAVLAPADLRMVPITMAVVVTDAADPDPICTIDKVASNVAVGANGPDWIVSGALNLTLRAEAPAQKDRIYTITVACVDNSGNRTIARPTVTVPHP